MSISNDEIVEKIREYRKKSGKTQQELADFLGKTAASISDLERGKVQVSACELSEIADFLNIPVDSFYSNLADDEYMQNVITAIKEEPEEARINSFQMVKLFLEIQSYSKKIKSNPNRQFSPEELGDILTKILAFQAQFKAMSSKLDSAVNDLIQVLKENGVTLPNL